jgi:hypothetical protein
MEFDIVYLRVIPKPITRDLIRFGIGQNKGAQERLRAALRAFKNPEIDHGFDGAVVYRHEDNRVSLTTIGATEGGYFKTTDIEQFRNLTPDVLHKLFCESLSYLEYSYKGN